MLEASLELVDAHHHLWDFDVARPFWLTGPCQDALLGDYSNLSCSYRLSDYLADLSCVRLCGSVHVQAGWSRHLSVAETAWLQASHQKSGYPSAIVVYADLSAPNLFSVLTEHLVHDRVRGVRQTLAWRTDSAYQQSERPYLADPSWAAGFGMLAQFGLSFDLQIYPEQVTDCLPILRRYDEVLVAINHLLLPIERDRISLMHWRTQLARLSELPNTFLKISGLGMGAQSWSDSSAWDLIRIGVDLFSPQRCMLGSNFPVDRLYASFDSLMASYCRALSVFSPSEQKAILCDTACSFYRFTSV